MNFAGAEWHFEVVCPGKTIRFSAGSVNESLTGWLGLIFPGLGGPNGAIIETPAGRANGDPACVKRNAFMHGTGFGGEAALAVKVTAVPCLIEAPPKGNLAYDPGGFFGGF